MIVSSVLRVTAGRPHRRRPRRAVHVLGGDEHALQRLAAPSGTVHVAPVVGKLPTHDVASFSIAGRRVRRRFHHAGPRLNAA
jgi:hypothetical protein